MLRTITTRGSKRCTKYVASIFCALFLLSFRALALDESSTPSHNLSLLDCLRIAIDHNPQLRVASEQYLVAKGQSLKLHAILYPTINAQALTAPTVLYVQVNQILYSRATFPQLRLSRLAQDQAVINYRQTLDDVVFQIRQAFINELAARQADELTHQYVASQSNALASAQQLFEAGKIQKSAVLGVQVTENQLVQRHQNSGLSVIQARLALDNLLGEELPPDTRLTGELSRHVPGDLNQETLVAQALRDRADLRLLESLRLSEQQQILVTLKNALPVVGFSSNSAFQPPALGALSNFDPERNYDEPEVQRQEGNSQLPLSLYFTWVIFDAGNLAGQRTGAQADLESQDVAIAALKNAIPSEVAAALSAVKTEEDALRMLESSPSPDDLRHSAELDYQAGRIRQLDLANLQGEILQQERLRLVSLLRLNLAMAALDHALGHGLLAAPPPPHHP